MGSSSFSCPHTWVCRIQVRGFYLFLRGGLRKAHIEKLTAKTGLLKLVRSADGGVSSSGASRINWPDPVTNETTTACQDRMHKNDI